MHHTQYERLYEVSYSHWWCRGMRQITLSLLKAECPETQSLAVLDVGCGAGAVLAGFPSRLAVGLDLSLSALHYASQHGLGKLVNGSAMRLPFDSQSFDVVLCLDVLYHVGLENSEQALLEIHRVMKTNGLLMVRSPAYPWLQSSHDMVFGTRRRMRASQLKTLLEGAGFVVRRMTYANTILFPFAVIRRFGEIVNPLHKKGPLTGDLFVVPAWLDALLYRTLWLESIMLTRWNLRFGISLYCIAYKKLALGTGTVSSGH